MRTTSPIAVPTSSYRSATGSRTRSVLAPTRSSASASGPCSWGQASIASCAPAPTIGRAPISPPWWCRRAAVVYYKLVLDPDDGTLLGAGVVPPEELGIVTDPSGWSRMLLDWDRPALRVYIERRRRSEPDLDWSRTRHSTIYLRYDKNKNYFSSIFEVEEGFVSIDPQDFRSPAVAKNERPTAVRPAVHAIPESEDWSLRSFRAVDEPVRVERARDRAHLGHEATSRRLARQPSSWQRTTTSRSAMGSRRFCFARGPAPTSGSFAVVLVSLDWRAGLGFRQNQYNGSFVQESALDRACSFTPNRKTSTSPASRQRSSATSG